MDCCYFINKIGGIPDTEGHVRILQILKGEHPNIDIQNVVIESGVMFLNPKTLAEKLSMPDAQFLIAEFIDESNADADEYPVFLISGRENLSNFVNQWLLNSEKNGDTYDMLKALYQEVLSASQTTKTPTKKRTRKTTSTTKKSTGTKTTKPKNTSKSTTKSTKTASKKKTTTK